MASEWRRDVVLVLREGRGGEWQIAVAAFTKPTETRPGLDDLGLAHWYWCADGAFVYPGSEQAFLDQCRGLKLRAVVDIFTEPA